jgi:DNA-binding NarL/FixJ family response regulator
MASDAKAAENARTLTPITYAYVCNRPESDRPKVELRRVGGNKAKIRVIVVDDHDLFRTGLSSLLAQQPDFEVLAQASGGRAAVRLARELHPDVVLMDLNMPDLGGEEATRQIIDHQPEVRIVVLTVASEETAVAAAIRAGACGYLVKDSPINEVISAARAAAGGQAWLSSRAAVALLDRVRREEEEPEADPAELAVLTSRELDVLRLVAQGRENTEIAIALGISSRTAKNHVSSILAKLELDNRVQAAVFAVQHKLL